VTVRFLHRLEQFSQRIFGRAQLGFTAPNTNHYTGWRCRTERRSTPAA
jgi:hypothetical protein